MCCASRPSCTTPNNCAAAAAWTASVQIVGRLTGMVDRFTTTLDCLDIGFLPDDMLDELPVALPDRRHPRRWNRFDVNKPRIRAALTAVLALTAAPGGFTVKDLATRVHTITGNTDYSARHAAYDLRKLRGKELITKPGRSHRYQISPLQHASSAPSWPCATT